MSYKAQGKIVKVFDAESKSASFTAREFVIEVADGQYPQMVKFQLVQDKCSLIDGYNEGEEIEVDFDLRGREWNEKYFTNLQAWKIGRAGESGGGSQGGGAGSGAQGGGAPAASGATTTSGATADFDDDIPF